MNPPLLESVTDDTARSLAQALPAVSASQAAAARLVHDRRFIAWARGFAAGLPMEVASTVAVASEASVRLNVGTSAGAVTLLLPRLASTLIALISDLAAASHRQEQACALASAWLRSIQAAPGLPIKALCVHEVTAVPATRSRQPGVPCIFIDGCGVQVLALDSALGDEVRRRMEAVVSAPSAAPWLTLRSRLRVDLPPLSLDTLRSLAVGDVLLVASHPAPGLLHVGDGDALGAPATFSHAPCQLTLTGPLISLTPEPLPMSTDIPDDPDSSGAADLLKELPLTVSFELETMQWTLEQLASMGAGQIVPLQSSPEQAVVRLICQGRVIGHGQLISLGANLGVRIGQTRGALDDAL